eukprot:FR744238.1.p1 GENE.FR744238.1~~FR744238.1.p1  ORF type:complete len:168 (+),score=12.85 FR744238.1:445-948(+)
MREKLLREVGTLTIISTSCMTLRALALLLVADKAVFLDRMVPFSLAYAYFVVLEAFPLVVVLVFYRRMPLPGREVLPEETKLLGGSTSVPAYHPNGGGNPRRMRWTLPGLLFSGRVQSNGWPSRGHGTAGCGGPPWGSFSPSAWGFLPPWACGPFYPEMRLGIWAPW